ncbi:hypothetical protein [Bradyrhizobium sp. STM 3557]|uniref:hypothetical protein n=1 Tax=Bradyrhizobium sp. STM 3557 TaxID=578920 RepID=UPI00388E419A
MPARIAPDKKKLCLILVACLCLASTDGWAMLDDLAGTWSGTGWMKPSDGAKERIRCRASYVVKRPAKSMTFDLKCASEAYKMLFSAEIEQDGTSISGNWFESEYRQGGKIYGTSSEGLIEARVEGNTVAALVEIRTKANHQSFALEAPGAWASEVVVELDREGK